MTLSPRRARELRAFLFEIATGRMNVEARARELADWLAPRRRIEKTLPGPSLSEKRLARKAAHNEATATLRAAVEARAGGWCEACGDSLSIGGPGVLDHWLGGSGRRRQQQSLLTTWLLCRFCDRDRTHNRPSAAEWNERRRRFCERARIPFVPHVEHQQRQRRSHG